MEAMGGTERGPPAVVAAVGHDKAGALAIMQQSIVPDLVTETPVTGLLLSPAKNNSLLLRLGSSLLAASGRFLNLGA